MRPLRRFIVHCSDTPDARDVDAAEIRKWHLANGWKDIGYHFVIRRDGSIEFGRPIEQSGAHVQGHNYDSVGVCMVGRYDFDPRQFDALRRLYGLLKLANKDMTAHGHRDFTEHKTCPNFDVAHVLELNK